MKLLSTRVNFGNLWWKLLLASEKAYIYLYISIYCRNYCRVMNSLKDDFETDSIIYISRTAQRLALPLYQPDSCPEQHLAIRVLRWRWGAIYILYIYGWMNSGSLLSLMLQEPWQLICISFSSSPTNCASSFASYSHSRAVFLPWWVTIRDWYYILPVSLSEPFSSPTYNCGLTKQCRPSLHVEMYMTLNDILATLD